MKDKLIKILCFFNIHIKRTTVLDSKSVTWVVCPKCKKYLNNEFK